MLVTLRNAHESGTNDDAEKLLHILSSNPQNVLLMAEGGYFRPLPKRRYQILYYAST